MKTIPLTRGWLFGKEASLAATQLPPEALHGLPAAESRPSLQKVAVVVLDGQEYDIAKNGGFHLVRAGARDAYGRSVAVPLDLEDFLFDSGGRFTAPRAQALLDALGEALVRLQGQRDLRLGGEGSAE